MMLAGRIFSCERPSASHHRDVTRVVSRVMWTAALRLSARWTTLLFDARRVAKAVVVVAAVGWDAAAGAATADLDLMPPGAATGGTPRASRSALGIVVR